MDVKLYRDDGIAVANIPHKVVRHSPCGFEWGYSGSGPADLALNILLLFTNEEQANALYQQFKREVIAHIPYEGGEIKDEFIRNWVQSHIEFSS